ncbi:Hermansky-Pudlak syndrome 3 protein [Protopterus annectens]|uniref:Hermansky-Pudlak syndrome 3 protein n=1 Tax=Protopterus annectens TaxID=7888 RepID=UPI001CFA3660|nr:Hermansky-Pudlak syndrome 3 protein [Protopterus annectens]
MLKNKKMVQIYNCHPFVSQEIIPIKNEPDLICCGGDSLFVVSAGGCKIEVFDIRDEGPKFLCSFATIGKVLHITYSEVGDYLVTIEEKNAVTSLRAYMNWKFHVMEMSPVGVRMVGHMTQITQKEQMEIVEMPVSEPPTCISCCPVEGDLLVGCRNSLVIFCLKQQSEHGELPRLDFECSLMLHLTNVTPLQVAFCAGYIGVITDLEAFILKLDPVNQESKGTEKILTAESKLATQRSGRQKQALSKSVVHSDQDNFIVCQRPVELLGADCSSCGISIKLEWLGLPDEQSKSLEVNIILYRCFAPDYSQGYAVDSTRLHSLQLLPMYCTGNLVESEELCGNKKLLSLFCFFSLPHTGYLYTVMNAVELIATYQYSENSQQAHLTLQFLHVITSSKLQCYTTRCSAAAARQEDPYIDTDLKACPPTNLDVCILRMQLFLGLKSICHFKNHIILLTKASAEEKVGKEKVSRKFQSGKSSSPVRKPKISVEAEAAWNLYVINTVTAFKLYKEMVEYSKRYQANMTKSCIHLLNEAHLLLRGALMDHRLTDPAEKKKLLAAFKDSCAELGDCFSRFNVKNYRLALPYYKMSGLSLSDVISRDVSAIEEGEQVYRKSFLVYLKQSLFEEVDKELSKEAAFKVLQIFSISEPSHLPHVICSPCMRNTCPTAALEFLQKLEAVQPSCLVTLAKATVALKMKDLQLYRREMARYNEIPLVLGFTEEPRLLVSHKNELVIPTEFARHLKETQAGLLVAALVSFHENSRISLEEVEIFFKVLCEESAEDEAAPQLMVDFWEALLVYCAHESMIQELLFKLTVVYIQRICGKQRLGARALKTAEDLMNSYSQYGLIFPWVNYITPSEYIRTNDYPEEVQKLQSLLCGPSIGVSHIQPLVEQLPQNDNVGLSIRVLCDTRLGKYEMCVDKLLDQCPQAVLPYAYHEMKEEKQVLWWKKLLPELCRRIRGNGCESHLLVSSLKETLSVVANQLDPLDFLNLLPHDGAAVFFLPYLLQCCNYKQAS